jgi:hypothetical protein
MRIELGPATAVDDLLPRLQEAIEGTQSAEYLEVGGRVYDLVWAPLSPYLGERQLVYVVPDGNLVDIPFGALPHGNSSAPLIDRYDIAYLFSAHQLVPWPDQVPSREHALIVSLSRFHDNKNEMAFWICLSSI